MVGGGKVKEEGRGRGKVKEEGRGRPGEENVVKSIGDVLEVS